MSTKPYQQAAQYHRKFQTAQTVALPEGIAPSEIAAPAALYVTHHRREHQTGPTWCELAARLHPNCASECGPHAPGADRIVSRVHAHRIVSGLVQDGWLSATRQKRSLRLGTG